LRGTFEQCEIEDVPERNITKGGGKGTEGKGLSRARGRWGGSKGNHLINHKAENGGHSAHNHKKKKKKKTPHERKDTVKDNAQEQRNVYQVASKLRRATKAAGSERRAN